MFQRLSNVSDPKISGLFKLRLSIVNGSLPFFIFLNGYFMNLSILTRFKHILLPIAAACVANDQQEHVDFESFFTHTICHECCHGIGPHTITLPNGQKSTVRLVSSTIYFTREISLIAKTFAVNLMSVWMLNSLPLLLLLLLLLLLKVTVFF